ncbi:MAG: GNAT family N-acetyltransferase [Eubacteriales bacterium]
MEIRKILPEEHMDILKLRSASYNSKKDFSDPEKTKLGYEKIRAVFDDSGKACSTTCIEPYIIRFNSSNVKMAGIGAVATLPQERNKGYVRKLFNYCYEEMRENEQIFSYLFPFSHPYYRMFGYEVCYDRQLVSMSLNAFAELKASGRVEQLVYEKHIEDVKDIYNCYIKNKNLAVVRTDEQWKSLFDRDPYTELYSTYIWYDSDGNPASYISYDSSASGQNEINVCELAFKNYEALKGLLGFLNKFHPLFKAFKGYLPSFIDLTMLVAEPILMQRELKTCGMNRIIDVEKVLSYLNPQTSNSSVNIEVSDSSIPWNNGIFTVSFEDGSVSVKKTSNAPDLSCSVQSLAQFATGYISLAKACDYKTADIFGKREFLFSLFPQKEMFMTESF